MTVDKAVALADEAAADVHDEVLLAVGGFGLSGVPILLIGAPSRGSATDLQEASNNCGTDGWGLRILLEQHRITRVVASYIGENKEFGRQYLASELELLRELATGVTGDEVRDQTDAPRADADDLAEMAA